MVKPLTAFGLKNREKQLYQTYCKECQRAYAKRHYSSRTDYYKAKAERNNPKYKLRNKEYVVSYLLDHPCVDCGEPDIEVLQFDHIEMVRVRSDRVGAFMAGSLENLIDEIGKCEVRCANCHFRRTRKQMGWYRAL
jgi:hypothetical protein